VLRRPFNYQAVDSGVLGELTPLTHGVSVKSSGSHKTDMLPMLLSGSLLTVLQFPTLFERDGCDSFDTWHVHCADSEQDHQWVTRALLRPPSHCRRACVIPHTTWLRGINIDEKSVDIGIHSTRRKASNCTVWWRQHCNAPSQGMPLKKTHSRHYRPAPISLPRFSSSVCFMPTLSTSQSLNTAVFKLGSADQRGSATGSHGVRERIPKSSNCLHGF